MLTVKKEKRNEHGRKYNRKAIIISLIDTILGVAAIGLGIARVGLLSTIVAAPAVIGIEAMAIVVGIIKVMGNQAKKTNVFGQSRDTRKDQHVGLYNTTPSVVSLIKH